MLKKTLAELIGSFFLFLAIAVAGVAGHIPAGLAPVAIGITLAVMVYAAGHLSGAHFNPAVTMAACMRGKCRWIEAPGYLAAQLGGMALAAWIAHGLTKGFDTDMGGAMTNLAGDRTSMIKVVLAEGIGTLGLVWVILNVATAKDTAGNSFYGIAIGGTVMGLAFVLGPVSGGAFNPAVAFGKCFNGDWAWVALPVYVCAQGMGAVLSAGLFRLTHRDEE